MTDSGQGPPRTGPTRTVAQVDGTASSSSSPQRQQQNPEMSTPTSPTDSRHPLSRYESVTRDPEDDQLATSFQSTDTVRRRPESQATGYGTIASSSQAPSQASSDRQFSVETAKERPQPRNVESARSLLPLRSPQLGPIDRGRLGHKSKRPGTMRRASSNVQTPHRGQEFSVDDNVTELENDIISRQGSVASGFGSSRLPPASMRRRPTVPALATVTSSPEDDDEEEDEENESAMRESLRDLRQSLHEDHNSLTEEMEEDDDRHEEDLDGEDEGDLSDAESFTLKDRQQAINETHPFGIRIWKPALYKKDRSVQKTAEGDIHSSPGGRVSRWLLFFNLVWTLCFGWWLALTAFVGALVCFIFGFAPSAVEYGRVLWGLSGYLLYPFGKFVRLEQDEAYAHEDENEGRSVTEYEQWQSGDIEDGRLFFGPQHTGDGHHRSIVGRRRQSMDSEAATETDSLLGRRSRGDRSESPAPRPKRRLFGRGQWNLGRVIFFLFFYGLLTPMLFLVSGICWALVFWIPMGKVTQLLFYHLRRHPLALTFQSDTAYSRGANDHQSSILVCTYRAVGIKYWKYTVDGTNIFLINLMGIVLFVIFDYWILAETLHMKLTITHPAFLFIMALFSIIPLAYFIGQAVASISAQSSMGLGAAINAFFSTIVEVFLYCIALNQGKGQLVEGSIIGSIFAGVLFLPGLSMCFGAIKRKTQRFNAKSAGVTSTMLLFAVIAAFGPTLFYQIYGTHELNCMDCVDTGAGHHRQSERDCRRCFFSQVPSLNDRFYLEAVRPYCWFAASLLFCSYVIGLWFTLRTHAAVIWNAEVDEKKTQMDQSQQLSSQQQPFGGAPHGRLSRAGTYVAESGRQAEIRNSQLYKKILGQSLKQVGLTPRGEENSRHYSGAEQTHSQPESNGNGKASTPHLVPPKSAGGESLRSDLLIPGLTDAQNTNLVREVAEMAATAATIAARDATAAAPLKQHRKHSFTHNAGHGHGSIRQSTGTHRPIVIPDMENDPLAAGTDAAASGGHDAPNWSRVKSSVILCGATVLYALIAEILVNTVDVVLEGVAIDEKFLGITLFALVPNTTEFLNAISFAMNGNIALSMEIGSAYALQVCLLQIPALVLFSAVTAYYYPAQYVPESTFSLIFPQWDMVTVILCVFLLSYMYGEGKSNYFKGSILLLSYLVVVVGFWFSAQTDMQGLGASRFDMLEAGTRDTFRTAGRGSGVAWQV